MNMGYCRFENTLNDLRDCMEHMWDDDLSDSEEESRQKMIELCVKISEDYGI